MIKFYKEFGPLGYLASYSNHGFELDGHYWPTVEHYYQAQKFTDSSIKERIRLASTPKEASKIGRDRSLPIRSDWDEIREKIMFIAVLEKFKSNADIRQKLLDTGNEEIVECTTKEWFWGCGPDGTGQNAFGKILCSVREKLRNNI